MHIHVCSYGSIHVICPLSIFFPLCAWDGVQGLEHVPSHCATSLVLDALPGYVAQAGLQMALNTWSTCLCPDCQADNDVPPCVIAQQLFVVVNKAEGFFWGWGTKSVSKS